MQPQVFPKNYVVSHYFNDSALCNEPVRTGQWCDALFYDSITLFKNTYSLGLLNEGVLGFWIKWDIDILWGLLSEVNK